MSRFIKALRPGEVLSSGIKIRPEAGRADRPTALEAEDVIARLEAAGATSLAIPSRGYTTLMRQMRFDLVHSAADAYGWQPAAVRAAAPTAAEISQMDEAFSWIALIPEAKYVLRRIVGARALVHPLTARHLYPWRRLAKLLGADHKSIQRWHGQGIDILVRELRG